jgi:hypothetical protein
MGNVNVFILRLLFHCYGFVRWNTILSAPFQQRETSFHVFPLISGRLASQYVSRNQVVNSFKPARILTTMAQKQADFRERGISQESKEDGSFSRSTGKFLLQSP